MMPNATIESLEQSILEIKEILNTNKQIIEQITLNYMESEKRLEKVHFPEATTNSEIVMPVHVPPPQPLTPVKATLSAQKFFYKDYIEFPDIYSEFKKGLETPEEIFKANVKDSKFKFLVAKRCKNA